MSRDSRHIVITDQSHGLPYSKGLMASSLMVSGLPANEAFEIAGRIEETLTSGGRYEVDSGDLRTMAAALLSEVGEEYASRYMKWQAVEELDVPLIILLGGATGVGKSTIATLLAARLGITRVVSTDAIREVLRSAFSKDMMPSLHQSSFTADAVVKTPIPPGSDPLLLGFQDQVSVVSVGVKALISRAIEEGTDMIIEGAHVVPGFLEGWKEEFTRAVIVPIVMTVAQEDLHKSHFHMRALETRSSRHAQYLAAFENIRKIRTHIDRLAREHGVPVIEAFDIDSTLQEIVSIVVETALSRIASYDEVETTVPKSFEVTDEGRVIRKHRLNRLRSWEALSGRRKTT